ncbi:Conserved_hypothetical protein [Hexamita inflata]|uniref:Uncharacterized protein n=1 Tax=Hexamita inflata TaxID=28002 RepID=A0AA86TP85_9EUKA|nr:Conserved hypothetical protein [Hexamita inflata]
MFILKPITGIEFYLSIQDGNLCILDKDLTCIVLKQIPYQFSSKDRYEFCSFVDYVFYLMQIVHDEKYQVPLGYLNAPLLLNGRIFFNVFDFVFELTHDMQVKLLYQIPGFYKRPDIPQQVRSGFHSGQIFGLNQQLYMQNNSTKLFKLSKQNYLKCVNNKHYNTHYYQFCDAVYALNEFGLYRVQSDLSLVRIWVIENMKVVFVGGGTLVLGLTSVNGVTVLNMLDGAVRECPWLGEAEICAQIELGPVGIQLQTQFLAEIFGAKFEECMVETVKLYREKNGIKRFSRGFANLIFGLDFQLLINEKRDKNFETLIKLTRKINLGKYRIKLILQANETKVRHMIEQFNFMMTSEDNEQ